MKRFLLLTLLSPILLALTASAYVPMIREDRVWEYCGPYQATPMSEPDAGIVFHYMKFDGTLEVQGKEYHRFVLFKSIYNRFNGENSDNFRTETKEGPVYLLREEEGKVFALCQYGCIARNYNPDKADALENLTEFKLYDFTLSDGDTWEYPLATTGDVISDTQSFTVRYLDPVSAGGEECKVMAFESQEDYSLLSYISFIEGLGVTYNGSLASFDLRLINGLGNSYEEPKYEAALNRVLDADGNVVYQSEGAICPPTPTYVPMIREDRVWEYVGAYRTGDEMGYVVHCMKFDGTQEVMGKEYHRFVLFKSTYVYHDYDATEHYRVELRNEPAYLLREEEGKVYALYNYNPENADATGNLSEFKLYDFTLSDGDTWEYPSHTGGTYDIRPYTVRVQAPVNIDGEECRVIRLEDQSNPGFELPIDFIEGVGINLNGSMASFALVFITGDGNSYYEPEFWAELNRVLDADGNVVYGDGSAPPAPKGFDEDLTWTYCPTNPPLEYRRVYRYQMKFDGTTDIGGRTWHNFKTVRAWYDDYDEDEDNPVTVEMPTGDTFLIREEDRRYYVRLPKEDSGLKAPDVIWDCESEEAMLADFNCGVGDSFTMLGSDLTGALTTRSVTVTGVGNINIDGSDKKILYISDGQPLIEGFGPTCGTLAYTDFDWMAGSQDHLPTSLPDPTYNEKLIDVKNSDGYTIFAPEMIYGEDPNDDYYRRGWIWKYSVPRHDVLPDGRKIAYHFWMKYSGEFYIDGKIWHEFITSRATASEVVQISGSEVEEQNTVELPTRRTFLIRKEGGRFFVMKPRYNPNESYLPNSWWHIPDTGAMLYDFDCGEGNTFSTLANNGEATELTVGSVSTVTIADREYRVQYVNGIPVVEGIGFARNGVFPFISTDISETGTDVSGIRQYWPCPEVMQELECIEDRDGNVIFTPSMLNGGGVDGIAASDSLTIRQEGNVVSAASDSDEMVTIAVVGIDGAKRLAVAGRGAATADLSTLATGVYVVRATDGNDVKTLKVMIND